MQRDLSYFIAIAKERNVTSAARSLGVTQSALTKSLRRLEEHLGVQLVERGTRGVHLTELGERILIRARCVEAEMRSLELEAKELKNNQTKKLKFGVSPSWAVAAVPEIIRRFRKLHPEVELTVETELEVPLVKRLSRGNIDFALCADVPGAAQHGIFFDKLFELDVLVACRLAHPLFQTWDGDPKTLLAADWLNFRSALERQRNDAGPLASSISGSIVGVESWFSNLLIASKNDFLVALPEHIADHIADYDIAYLSNDYRVKKIEAGVWARLSASETQVGKVFLAVARSVIMECKPISTGHRKLLI
ncbi:MAG: DNA-binding transcriptional LysR family regulator [Celeribacter sp.]|jgi:DNA-binding transcriptional LysR family regulator